MRPLLSDDGHSLFLDVPVADEVFLEQLDDQSSDVIPRLTS